MLKTIIYWILRFVTLSTMLFGIAYAAPSAEVVKGLNWLQNQVLTTGTLSNEQQSIAIPLQNRSEAAHTLKLLATPPDALLSQLSQDLDTQTEHLARRIIALSLAGQSVTGLIEQLNTRQNPDGGYPSDAGYASNILDSAWVILAQAQQNQANGTAAQNARNYLISNIQNDGSIGSGGDTERIQNSALALLALQTSNSLTTSTAIKNLSNWLLLKQQANGSWLGDSYLSALSLSALTPLISDPAVKANAQQFLLQLQNTDGSWAADPFLTAVILRALNAETINTTNTFASLIGQVFDQNSATAISGATITLSGASNASQTSALDGKFSFNNLAAGNYNLQISKSGYSNYSTTASLNKSQTLDIGKINLSQLSTSGIIKGQVISSSNNQALSGVTVTLNNTQNILTDNTGRYEFSNVAPGSISISASLTGYNSASGTASILAGQTLFFSPTLYPNSQTPPTTGRYQGKVVNAGNNSPLAGVSIQLTGNSGTASGTTGTDGSFDLTLNADSYRVSFSKAGYSSANSNLLLSAGTTVNGNIALAEQLTTSTISGIITDVRTGQPISGAQIQILEGQVTTSAADGSYSLTALSGNLFSLRAGALGYASQTLQIQTSQPANLTQNFALDKQSVSELSLSDLIVTPGSVAPHTDVTMTTTVTNKSSSATTEGLVSLLVVNPAGDIIGQGVVYDQTGSNLLGTFTLAPQASLPVVIRWNSTQFAAGNYQLQARVIEAGSVSKATPLGRVLAETQANLAISEAKRFSGTTQAEPPVLQINTNTTVHLSAILRNDGNVALPGQNYRLQVIDEKNNNVVLDQITAGNSLAVNDLLSLTFADWVPNTAGGNYRLEITAENDLNQGKVTGKLYIGDAATANFTVNKLAVPTGNQTVKGSIHITGQDATQVTISDPLAPLIKAAVQKAVTYNDAVASNWYQTNSCLGCHVVSQALVGGEMNRKITTFNVDQRKILFNAIINHQKINGTFDQSHESYERTQTILGAWALSSWYKKDEIASSMFKAVRYLASEQRVDGSWESDYAVAWWKNRTANTGITIKTFVDTAALAKQFPEKTDTGYQPSPEINNVSIPGVYKTGAADIDGNIYVASATTGTLSVIRTDGTVQTLLTGLPGPHQITLDANGDIYIPNAPGGVYKYSSSGVLTKLTNIGSASVAIGPDGNVYIADYYNHKIVMISSNGVLSDYITEGLHYPHSIVFNKDGELLVANSHRSQIVKFNPDKTYTVVVPVTDGNPYSIRQVGNRYLVATSLGLYRYNQLWQVEKLRNGSTWSMNVAPGNKILTNAGGVSETLNILQEVTTQESIDSSIRNATNWLLQDENTDNSNHIELAMRMIGLGSAKQYYAGTTMEGTIQAKLDQAGSLLRSRQRNDGGWGLTPNHGSDSMITAMVGMGLDHLKLSPKDPVIQNAIKLLLANQLPDGSWLSNNGVLDTHLSATTWVAIWLPVALDRIAGIDTDLTLTMPNNVSLSNPSIEPTSSSGSSYTWKLQGVTAAGQDISFDLALNDMQPGENRPVAQEAYLTFNNSFTQSKVNAPVGIPRVTASAYLNLGVTTDKTSYTANNPVNISAVVNNVGSSPLTGSVQLQVFAADNVLVRDLGKQSFSNLAAGAQQPLYATWGTGLTLAGNYYVLATLFDAQNRQVGTAPANFSIVANGANGSIVGSKLATDKVSYQPYDVVKFNSLIKNLSLNQSITGHKMVLNVTKPDGQPLFNLSNNAMEIVASNQISWMYDYTLRSAAAGNYNAILTVLNSTGTEVSRSQASFSVLSSADTGSGLLGTLNATPKQVPQGEIVNLSGSLSNFGNVDLSNTPVTLSVVDPLNQTVLYQQPINLNLAQGQSFNYGYSWDTRSATLDNNYVAALTAVFAGKTKTLATDTFKITGESIKLDVQQRSLRQARLLVWLNCDREDDSKEHEGKKTNASKSSQDDEHEHQKTNACVQTRLTYLTTLLNNLAVSHLITTTRAEFTKAMRSGYYNLYWLSGKAQGEEENEGKPSYHDLARELREAVNRGDGLIIDGKQSGLAEALQEALGIKNQGQHAQSNVALASSEHFGQATTSQGRAQKMLSTQGTARVYFGASVNPANSKAPWPAVISNRYGQGLTLVYGFDLITSLQQGGELWKQRLQNDLEQLSPALPNVYTGGAYVLHQTTIQNLAQSVNLDVKTVLPSGSVLLQSQPNATLDANGQPNWQINLAKQASQNLLLTFRLPTQTGDHSSYTTIDSAGKRYGEYSSYWNVKTSERIGRDLILDLNLLNLSKGQEREARDQAVRLLEQTHSAISQKRYGYAIGYLLDAADKLRKISSTDISTHRLNLDMMLQQTAWEWVNALPSQPSGNEPADEHHPEHKD